MRSCQAPLFKNFVGGLNRGVCPAERGEGVYTIAPLRPPLGGGDSQHPPEPNPYLLNPKKSISMIQLWQYLVLRISPASFQDDHKYIILYDGRDPAAQVQIWRKNKARLISVPNVILLYLQKYLIFMRLNNIYEVVLWSITFNCLFRYTQIFKDSF